MKLSSRAKVIIFLVALGVLIFSQNRKIILWVVLTMVSTLISYAMARKQLRLDLSPVFFFSIFMTNYMGWPYSIAFMAYALTVPTIIGGMMPDPITFLFGGNLILINFISTLLLPIIGFVPAGLLMAVLEIIGSSIINTFVGRTPAEFMLFSIFAFLVNVVYFMGFGHILLLAVPFIR